MIWFYPLSCRYVSWVFLYDFTPWFFLHVLFISWAELYLRDLFIHDLQFVHSRSEFYLCNLLFLHGLILISTFYLFASHLVKWVSTSFSSAYLTIFLSMSLCIFLSDLPHDFLSVSSYGFFLCAGFYPLSEHEFTLQVWTVSYSTWMSEGIRITECLLC